MNNFTFFSPTKFVFGKDTESQAGALVKEFGLPEGGTTGGFVKLSAGDIAEIYKIAARATI